MRTQEVYRKTKETEVTAKVNLDGEGKTETKTGIAFFDHLLTSFGTHSLIDTTAKVDGDLKHHCIEDLAIGLGEALNKALEPAKAWCGLVLQRCPWTTPWRLLLVTW
jgi:imidazoleglycerol phosphate dehydratase HisB